MAKNNNKSVLLTAINALLQYAIHTNPLYNIRLQNTMKLIARKPLFLPRQNRLEHPIDATQKGATQKGVTQNKPTWLKNLGWGCIILAFILTGCDKVKQIASQRNASVTASTTASTTAANPPINPTSQPTPVVYPINEWQQQTLANKVSIHDTEAVTLLLGQPLTIDKQSLDYRSNVASKYSFAKTGEPYFDLLDSPMYIELQWYYASAYDNASVKNISIQHAKTAFHLTQNWFGQDGSDIVAHMVQGQPIKNTSYHGILVELARCDNYHCDLVVRKPTVTAKTAKKKRLIAAAFTVIQSTINLIK